MLYQSLDTFNPSLGTYETIILNDFQKSQFLSLTQIEFNFFPKRKKKKEKRRRRRKIWTFGQPCFQNNPSKLLLSKEDMI